MISAAKDEEMKQKQKKINWSRRKKIFAIFLFTCIFTNYDTGVIPASISHVKDEMNINNSEIAALCNFFYKNII